MQVLGDALAAVVKERRHHLHGQHHGQDDHQQEAAGHGKGKRSFLEKTVVPFPRLG